MYSPSSSSSSSASSSFSSSFPLDGAVDDGSVFRSPPPFDALDEEVGFWNETALFTEL